MAIKEKQIRIDGEFDIPVEDLTEMKLTCRNWENMRKKTGLKMTETERIAQLEMAHSSRTTDLWVLENKVKWLTLAVITLAVAVASMAISLLVR